ncbi:hypothetical protein PsYK624_096660 [Phanerochaete sordida]|uniref:Tse2 ADP-ribosyltransferase toxin domain-containing protein n=1 Tax=Phanerochaete sordida TaxID=48140 RepID=A0A9P3LGW7_9APHY|nr:hypothetical protein PsYK624_096660 [Phanerochaete sordida]
MSHPHPRLYRGGNLSSPKFDNVRPNDIQTDGDGNVHPGTGGISTFSVKNACWDNNKTWVLLDTTVLPPGLQARNDLGNHWSIEPAAQMPMATYVSYLTQLNPLAVRYDRLSLRADEPAPAPRPLKAQSTHADRATRFVYGALVAVVHAGTPVDGWDANDYAYIAEIAHGLEDGDVPLDKVVWRGGGWTKEKASVAAAVAARIAHEDARVKESGDEDAQADAYNDHAYLRLVLALDDKENPVAV